MKRNKLGQFISEGIKGKNNYNWKGGIPKCKLCKKQVSAFRFRYCRSCYLKTMYGKNNPHWKGGKRISEEGYIEIYKPNHHRARQNGYVYQHILIAEKKYKRKITRREQVHHLNGIKDDNRPENLVVILPKDHDRFTIRHTLQKRIRELETQIKRAGTE